MFISIFHILLNVSECFTSCSECVEAMPGCFTQHLAFYSMLQNVLLLVQNVLLAIPGYFTQHLAFYSMLHNVLLHVQNVLRLCQDV